MANSLATGLKVLFTALGLAMAVALTYTLAVDGSPFQREYLQPWLVRALFDFYVNVAILSAWIIYKESSWISALVWIILLACVGSTATCVYIVIQLFKLSQQETEQDPIYHVLLRHPNKNNGEQTTKHVPVIAGIVVFGVLGCLVLGVLVYTAVTHWSVYLHGFTTPWAPATLVDFTVNFSAIAVWVAYKESCLIRAVLWIISMFLLGGFVICTYVVAQLSRLSSQDPLYLVLFRSGDREEGKYERATF